MPTRSLSTLLCLLCLFSALPFSGSENIMHKWTVCDSATDGVDWQAFQNILKIECQRYDDVKAAPYKWPYRCDAKAVLAAHSIVQEFSRRALTSMVECWNGVVSATVVELTHWGTPLGGGLGEGEGVAGDPYRLRFLSNLIREGIMYSYILDGSQWPLVSFDVLNMLEVNFPWSYDFAEPEIFERPAHLLGLSNVTFLVPKCPTHLARRIRDLFPGVQLVAAPEDNYAAFWEEPETLAWQPRLLTEGQKWPTGAVLNHMIHGDSFIDTPFTFVVTSNLLPFTAEDLNFLIKVLYSANVGFVSAPLVDSDGVYVDFSYAVTAKHWKFSFDPNYKWSFEAMPGVGVMPPCKLNDLTSPSFLARTSALKASPLFAPQLTEEWAMLDWMFRVKRNPFVREEVAVQKAGRPLGAKGEQGVITEDDFANPATARSPVRGIPLKFAFCPGGQLSEFGWDLPHLWGRKDRLVHNEARLYWFQPVAKEENDPPPYRHMDLNDSRSPAFNAREFMYTNSLREFYWIDGSLKNFGCHLRSANCDMSWMYKGFIMPPCCRRTLARLMAYLHDTFAELGFKYMLTDGALLGAIKFGRLLDWDGDIDLHIENSSFERIETELVPRILADGYYIRPHPNGQSWTVHANDHNYLIIELNRRQEAFDDSFWVPVDGRLYRTLPHPELNLTQWYGPTFFEHGLRNIFFGRAEDSDQVMLCSIPGHHNCVDMYPAGASCSAAGLC